MNFDIFIDKYANLDLKTKGLFYLIYLNKKNIPLTVKVLIEKSKISKKTLRKYLTQLIEYDLIEEVRFGHNNLKYKALK